MSSSVLDRWEERLQDIFDGRPYDMLDAALTDTVFNFPLDIKVLTEFTSLGKGPKKVDVIIDLYSFFLTAFQGHDRGNENGYEKMSIRKLSRTLSLLLLCGWDSRPNECSNYGNCTRICSFYTKYI